MSAVLEHTTTTSTQPIASATCLPLNLRRRAADLYYNPTQGVIDAGVVKRKSFPLSKIEEACRYAVECNERIEEWRKETSHIAGLQKDGKVKDVVFAYLHSIDFTRLADITKTQYKSSIEAWRNVRVAGMALQHHKLSNLETPMIQRMYDEQVRQTSTYAANYNMTVYRIVLNYAIRCGYTRHNPFEKVRKKATKHRKVMWERDNVRAFLNVAFSRWQWRNIGLVFYMIYEWGQRVSDILNLKWDNINFDTNTVTITQSKRGATVKLPISEGLATMLKQQQKDFFLSSYVAPQMVRRQGKWTPYSIATLNSHVTDIMAEARLDKALQLRDLRRTAITETIENGGDLLTVMQMSGHQHAASVTPYFVHTRRGAAKAQEIRQFPQHLMQQPTLLQRSARC
jgi:integrase